MQLRQKALDNDAVRAAVTETLREAVDPDTGGPETILEREDPRIRELEQLSVPASATLFARDGYEPIERTAVEQMPAAAAGQQARDRAFARAARSVDRDDRRVIRGGLLQDQSCKDRPTLRASAGKPGKEVATFATSSISMLCCAITLAIAKAIAMR